MLISGLLAIGSACGALAGDAPPSMQLGPSKEIREKMATLHEQMAACLRSDKPVADCHAEMMKNCQETLGTQQCPMMGMGHGMRKHVMQNTPAGPTEQK
jgi:hypothetical protein